MEFLSRDQFRAAVKLRDNYCCVICGKKESNECNIDAHHILERRLWANGGYIINNGVSLCHDHHILAEQTILSCNELREAAGITTIVLPEHLYNDADFTYDKWGNIIISNGVRLKGELFFDQSVQKILTEGGVMDMFLEHIKYPRTMHCPWSNPSKDDRVIHDISRFDGTEVLVTEKMDGENTTVYSDYIHARSLSGINGEDHSYVKTLQARIGHDIPKGWRICGENMAAQHSIKYDNLETYFYVFSIWNERNNCLSWDETLEWVELLNLRTVPILYRGIYDEKIIQSLWNESMRDYREGYVVRITDSFSYADFRKVLMKFVRPSHVNTDTHWRHRQFCPNKLRDGVKLW